MIGNSKNFVPLENNGYTVMAIAKQNNNLVPDNKISLWSDSVINYNTTI